MTSVIIPKRSINDLIDEDLYTIPNSPVKSSFTMPLNQSSADVPNWGSNSHGLDLESHDYQSLFNFNANAHINHHVEVQQGNQAEYSNQYQKVFNDYSNPDQSFIQPNKLLKFSQINKLNQIRQQSQNQQTKNQTNLQNQSQSSLQRHSSQNQSQHHNKVNPQLVPPKRKIKTLETPSEKFDDYLFNPNIEPSSSINFNFQNDSSVFIHPNGSNQAFNDLNNHIEEKDHFMSGLEDYNEFEYDDDLSDCDSDSDEENEDEDEFTNDNYFNDFNDTDFKQVNQTPMTSNDNSFNDIINLKNTEKQEANSGDIKDVNTNKSSLKYSNGGFIDDFGIKMSNDYDYNDYENGLQGLHDNTALDLANNTIDTSNIKQFNDDLDLDMDMDIDMDMDVDMDVNPVETMDNVDNVDNSRQASSNTGLNLREIEIPDSTSESDNSEPVTPTTEFAKGKFDKKVDTTDAGHLGNKGEDHHCDLINPNNGLPCNKQFSRPYDLIRHQETIHASKKKIFRCVICEGREDGGEGNGKSKTFSRGDALSRHIKVKHQLVGKEALDLINRAKENVEYVSVNS